MGQSFTIPDDFRAFMREVATKVDWVDDRTTLLGPDALQHACGRGGRVDGQDCYRFVYLTSDGSGRWELELGVQQIRDIAAGVLDAVDAVQHGDGARVVRGEALLVWGEYDDDALRVRGNSDLGVALDALHAASMIDPCLCRLWSTGDEQAVVVINGNECAIYVVRAERGYGTSVGDSKRTDSFELLVADLGPIAIPWADCVAWRVAREALVRFSEHGELGEAVIVEGRIPSQLLMLGDVDRAAELESRQHPPADPAMSSVTRRTPHLEWAQRLIRSLVEIQLIEIDSSIADSITVRVCILLLQLGDDAQDSLEVAQNLAKEVERVRGVGALFATAGDLQIALRRTQEPTTQPVEIPFT